MSDTAAVSEVPRTNWAGNLTYGAERLVVPTTVTEAQEAVRAARKVRVVGSRHCFNDIADTPGVQISLEKLNGVLSLDRKAGLVTVEGGIRYGELGPWLDREGYALHNLASLPHISVAGAAATATHGSGVTLGCLATAITSLTFIDGGGDLVVVSRDKDGEAFAGVPVSLGALGVITAMTLKVQPAYKMRQVVYRDLPLSVAETRFDEIMASGDSVSMFTSWGGDTIEQVWLKQRVSNGDTAEAPATFFGARRSEEKMHPIVGVDAVNCTEQLGAPGPWHERLPHFRMGFMPASGDELQVEYFVPAVHAVGAVKTLHRLGKRFQKVLLVSEVRTIAADDLWMSPFNGQPCVAFHFSFRQDWPAVKKLCRWSRRRWRRSSRARTGASCSPCRPARSRSATRASATSAIW